MRNTFKLFLERSGQPYQVERDGKIIFTADGLPNHETSTKRQYIGFAPGTDIKPYDWVINSFGERFFIEDTKTIFVQKEPHCLNAYYLTQVEYQKSLQQNSATFNIQNAYGSVIGTQTYVTLNYNDSIQKELGNIDEIQTKSLNSLAKVGSVERMFEMTLKRMGDFDSFTTEFLSKESDADLAEVIMQLSMQQTILQAALKAASSIIPPTLVDFI